jgi:hypothetical protein
LTPQEYQILNIPQGTKYTPPKNTTPVSTSTKTPSESTPKESNISISKYVDGLSKRYISYDRNTGKSGITNPTALRSEILSLNLSDNATDQLLSFFGLSTNSIIQTTSNDPNYTPGSKGLVTYGGGR